MKLITAIISLAIASSQLAFAGSLLDNDLEVVFFEPNEEMVLLVVKEELFLQ